MFDDYVQNVPRCPNPLPEDLNAQVEALGRAWATSPIRPRVDPAVRDSWNILLDSWANDRQLPLFVRKLSGGRGSVLRRKDGHAIVPTDNSPAHWAFALAWNKVTPALREIRDEAYRKQIPVAFALKKAESDKADYCRTLGKLSLSRCRWNVCHFEEIGLGRVDLPTAPWDKLEHHFKKFLSPENMFVVPLEWSGLADVPAFIAPVLKADQEAGQRSV